MKHRSAAVLARFLLVAALAGPPATVAHAASWQWNGLADRERVTITLDRPGDPDSVDVTRTGRQTLTLTSRAVGVAPARLGGADPARAALVESVAPQPGGLRIDTRTPGFGYVVTRPAPDRVVVDIFRDPMGERWSPAEAGLTEAPAPGTAPNMPANAQGGTPGDAQGAPPAPTPPSTPPGTAPKIAPNAAAATAPNGGTPPGRNVPDTTTQGGQPAPAPAAPSGTGGTVGGAPRLTERPLSDATPPGNGSQRPTPPASSAPSAPAGDAPATPPRQVTGQLGATAAQPQAEAQPAAPQPPEAQRNFFSVPYSVRARINSGGPSDWPEEAAASAPAGAPVPVPARGEAGPAAAPAEPQPAPQAVAQAPAQPQAVQPQATQPDTPATQAAPQQAAQAGEARKSAAPRPEGAPAPEKPGGGPAATATGDATSPQARQAESVAKVGDNATSGTGAANATNATQVIYVDEKGNPVPPPPVPADLLEQAKTFMVNGDYPKALELLEQLRNLPATPADMREEVLYLLSDVLFAQNKDNILPVFDRIVTATNEAMNYNLKSHRVPQALLRLGLLNMRIGNSQEAEGYFNLLRRQFPHDDNVPLALYYAGEEAYKRGDLQRAADKFQSIVQDFPESKYVREGSVSLARTLHKMGYYQQAEAMLDFVDKRWGRFYLEYPQLLIISGDVTYQLGKLDDARAHYWLYYNLIPDGEGTDTALARIGDILARQKQVEPAREIYEETVRRYPDKDGGLISLMRLAENGIHDAPNVGDMFTVFQRPDNTRPVQAYTSIITGHPESALVPLARLKLAMWYLWNHQYPEALATTAEFAKVHPSHELLPKIRDVALQSFTQLTAETLQDGNYGRILQAWEQYPLLQENEKALSADTRVALGLSYSREGQPQKALEILDGFLKGPKDPKHGETALSLALAVYLENQSWQHIVDLTQSVTGWTLTAPVQRQADYALALAQENLGQPDKAVPLWQKLRENKDVPVEQRAYVNFFLSREAERKRELQNAYLLTRESLADFLSVAQNTPDKADGARIKDCLTSLMDITEAAGRLRESLDWAEQYAKYVPDSDPGYPAMRFRTARLQRKLGNTDAWKSILDDLVRRDPQSIYGRMAASELRTTDVTKGLSGFTQGGQQ